MYITTVYDDDLMVERRSILIGMPRGRLTLFDHHPRVFRMSRCHAFSF
jgi:hypothetical protein